jgi:hypothetical protein
VFLVAGVYINPTVVSWFSSPSKSTTEYGFTQFDIPNIVDTGQPNTALVSYSVSGNEPISEGNPTLLLAQVWFPFNTQYQILAVYVRPDNAFIYYPSTSQLSQPSPSFIVTSLTNDSLGRKVWVGAGSVEFAAAGVFGATVDIIAIPTPKYWNATHLNYPATMQFHDQIETITIAPSGTARQQVYENQNLSLTLFILFFASVDIAVTLYDHCYEVVTIDKKDASEQKPKDSENSLPKEIAPPIITRQGE